MLLFLSGLFAGAFFGIALMCILSVASSDDDRHGI